MPEAYRLVFARSALRELRQLPREDLRRIVKRIERLRSEPRPSGSQKLAGTDLYRIRQGDYRVLYALDAQNRLVAIIKVGPRREVYR